LQAGITRKDDLAFRRVAPVTACPAHAFEEVFMSEDRAAELNRRQAGSLPDHLGIVWEEARSGYLKGAFEVTPRHMAPNGFLHAASVIALTDSACGLGCAISLPERATGFTTIELKTNFLGAARDGTVTCEARLIHGGRTTQVWDAEARHLQSGKTIALFRCTQMILYPAP
jgi:1,4-dihydroxy-2-naphthoyl-CoA hydrolase